MRIVYVRTFTRSRYGTEVPALKESKQKKAIDEYKRLAFAFNLGQEEWLNFVALDRETASNWMDGLRMLKEKRPLEPETRNDVDVSSTTLLYHVALALLNALLEILVHFI
jgi:hypothetical protein